MEWLDDMVKGMTGITDPEPIAAVAPPKKLAWGTNDFAGGGEGMQFVGTTGRSATNNNPLNLEYRPGSYQDKYGAEMEPVSRSGKQRFAKFPDMESGYMAGIDQINLDARRGHTLSSFVNKFAPPHENPTGQIIQQYARATGVSPDTPLSEIDPHKLMVPMLARESSTRIKGQMTQRQRDIFQGLKAAGSSKRAFDPYQIATAGAEIPGPPAAANQEIPPQIHSYDPKGPQVDYLDGLITGKVAPAPAPEIPTPAQGPIISAPPEPMGPVISGTSSNLPLSTDTLPPQNITPAPFNTQVGTATVDEPRTKILISAKQRFPLEKPEEAMKRYFMRDGEIMYLANDGKVRKESGEGLTEKAKTIMAGMTSRAPEIVGGTVGLMSPIPGGLEIGTMLGGAVRRGSNQAIYGENPNYLLGAGEDLVGALVGRGLGAGINKIGSVLTKSGPGNQIGQMLSRETGILNPAEAQRLYQLGQQKGIDLTLGEINGSPTLQNLWKALSTNPLFPTANHKIARFIKEKRNPQVHDAIQRELNAIAPEQSALVTGEGAQGAVQNILGDLKQQRKLGSDPLYDIARQNQTPIDITPIHQYLDDNISILLPNGEIAKRLKDVQNLLSKKVTVGNKEVSMPVTDLSQLHSAKRELSLLQKQWGAPGSGGVDPESFAIVTKVKNDLNDLMIAANPDYGIAQAEYARLSKPITQFNTGDPNRSLQAPKVTSLMKRLNDLGAEDVETIPSIIFKEPTGVIAKTREWFVNNRFQDEWNTIIRGHLQGSLDKVFGSQANKDGNFGFAFRSKAYGIPAEVEKLKAAMDPTQFGSFNGLMEVLEQTGRIVYTNSQTASQLGAVEGIKDLSGGWVAKVFSGMTINPRTWGLIIREFRAPGNGVKLADALIDPATAPRIQALQLMPNSLEKAVKTMALMGSILGKKKLVSQDNYRNNQPNEIYERPLTK